MSILEPSCIADFWRPPPLAVTPLCHGGHQPRPSQVHPVPDLLWLHDFPDRYCRIAPVIPPITKVCLQTGGMLPSLRNTTPPSRSGREARPSLIPCRARLPGFFDTHWRCLVKPSSITALTLAALLGSTLVGCEVAEESAQKITEKAELAAQELAREAVGDATGAFNEQIDQMQKSADDLLGQPYEEAGNKKPVAPSASLDEGLET